MSNDLKTLRVKIEADAKGYRQTMQSVRKETDDTMNDVRQKTEKVTINANPKGIAAMKNEVKGIKDIATLAGQSVKNLPQNIAAASSSAGNAAMNQIAKIRDSLRQMSNERKLASGNYVKSDEYVNLENHIQAAEKALESYKAQKVGMEVAGNDREAERWIEVQNNIKAAEADLETYKQDMTELTSQSANGGTFDQGTYARLSQEISNTTAQLEQYRAQEQAMKDDGTAQKATSWQNLMGKIQNTTSALNGYNEQEQQMKSSGAMLEKVSVFDRLKSGINGVASGAKRAFSGISSFISKTVSGIQKASGQAAALIQRFKTGVSGLAEKVKSLTGSMFGLGNANNSAGFSFGSLLKKTLMYGFGIRSLFTLVNKLRSAVVDGINNMVQADPSGQVNASISSMLTSLTQLKNALAAAFAPIITAVAPIITRFIDMMTRATSAVGALFSALTGHKTTIKAVKVQQNYAATLSKSTASTNKAKKATESLNSSRDKLKKTQDKLNRSVLSFDELNKLSEKNDNDDASGSNGSPSAGDTGLDGAPGSNPYANMFEEVPIDSGIKNIADEIKKAWANADFTDIGRTVGEKLRDALNSIDWDKIKAVAEKIAKSIATFINGFLSVPGLFEAIGHTIAQGINTAVIFAHTLMSTIDWDLLGQDLGKGLNQIGKEVDWDMLGKTLTDGIRAALMTLHGFLKTFDFTAFGTDLGVMINSALNNIPWTQGIIDIVRLAKGITDGINAAIKQVDFGGITKKISDGFKGADWAGLGTSLGQLTNTAVSKIHDTVKNFDFAGVASSLSSGLNHFIGNVNWAEIAKTLSDSMKRALEGLITAIDKIDWKQIGAKVMEFLTNIDWAGVLSKGLIALAKIGTILPQILIGALEQTDWKAVGERAQKGLENIDWKGIFEALGELVGSIFRATFDLVKILGEAIASGAKNFGEYFKKKMEESGQDGIAGFFEGIVGVFKDIGTWIYDHIFKPFMDGFRNAFGIHSPSTVMAEQGGYVAQGLLNGIVDNLVNIGQWIVDHIFSPIKDGLVTAFQIAGGVAGAIVDIGKSIVEGIHNGATEALPKVQQFFQELPGKVKSAIGDAKTWIKEKGSDMIEGLRNGIDAVKESRLFTFFENLPKNVKGKIGDAKAWIKDKGSDMVTGIQNGWDGTKKTLGNTFGSLGKNVKNKIGDAKSWIKEKGSDMVTGIQNGWNALKESKLFGKSGVIGSVPDKTKKAIGNPESWLKTKGSNMVTGIKNGINNWSGLSGTLNKLPKLFESPMRSAYNSVNSWAQKIKSAVKSAADTAQRFMNQAENYAASAERAAERARQAQSSANSYSSGGGSLFGSSWDNFWNNFGFASGGFPEQGQMFLARERGPELVGTIGGRTAVANNDDIVAAVSTGVEEAVINAMSMMGTSQNTQSPVFEITVKTEDDEVLARAVTRGQQKLNYRLDPVGG